MKRSQKGCCRSRGVCEVEGRAVVRVCLRFISSLCLLMFRGPLPPRHGVHRRSAARVFSRRPSGRCFFAVSPGSDTVFCPMRTLQAPSPAGSSSKNTRRDQRAVSPAAPAAPSSTAQGGQLSNSAP